MISKWIYRMIKNFTIPMLVFVILSYYKGLVVAGVTALIFIASNMINELALANWSYLWREKIGYLKANDSLHVVLVISSIAFLIWQFGWMVGAAFIIAFIVYSAFSQPSL